MKTDYDIIIIGTGAGGGTLAHRLAPSGKSILLIERGGWLKREPENWSAEEVFVKGRYVSKGLWRDKNGKEFQPGTYHYVGGMTKMYGAALFRLRERDFMGFAHYDGMSPAWPIGYYDLEPYYTQAEHLYQVHGIRGEDPTDPPASAPYICPPVSHEPRIQKLSDDMAAAGYHPFHTPAGIMLNELNMPYSTCVRCKDCDGFPCVVHAKSDSEVIAVRPALQYPNVTLLINTQVMRLNTNASGTTITEVVIHHEGQTETVRGNIVVSSCGAANSARLLLMSANDKHPNGLANGSDQVGRNYMFHTSQAVLAISKEPNPTQYQKTLGLNDFYFGMEGFNFPVGSIQMVGKSQAAMYRGEKPIETLLAPNFVLEKIGGACGRFLADDGGPAEAGESDHGRQGGPDHAELYGDEPGPERKVVRQAQVDAGPARHARASYPAPDIPEERHRRSGRSAPVGDVSVRRRSKDVRARHELQGA